MAENDQMNRAVCDACAFEGEDDDDYEMGRMAERRADFLYCLFLRCAIRRHRFTFLEPEISLACAA